MKDPYWMKGIHPAHRCLPSRRQILRWGGKLTPSDSGFDRLGKPGI